MFRKRDNILGFRLEVFIVHPGGPFFASKDDGVWSIPKGLVNEGEDLLRAAKREFEEETGIQPVGEMIPLGQVKLSSGKVVYAWAFERDLWEEITVKSNYFTMEWPQNSGRVQSFPEVDRGGFFDPATAKIKLNPAQAPLVDTLLKILGYQTGNIGL
jgi:predicted NUDIX family NTP pyrophosphohydrolase